MTSEYSSQQVQRLKVTRPALCVHLCCRCGALPGRRKARTRASSRILTARPGSESSAPYPTPATSQSTLAARQALPWTQRTSATCGNAPFFRHHLWMEEKWWGEMLTRGTTGRETQKRNTDPSCCLAASHFKPFQVVCCGGGATVTAFPLRLCLTEQLCTAFVWGCCKCFFFLTLENIFILRWDTTLASAVFLTTRLSYEELKKKKV